MLRWMCKVCRSAFVVEKIFLIEPSVPQKTIMVILDTGGNSKISFCKEGTR